MTKDQEIQYQQKLNEFETGKITEKEWIHWCMHFLFNDPRAVGVLRRMREKEDDQGLGDQEI